MKAKNHSVENAPANLDSHNCGPSWNCCEPFNFKGDVDDYQATVAYANKVGALRLKYRSYVWGAEFCDNQDAVVTFNGKRYERFSVFAREGGKRAAVIVNVGQEAATAKVQFLGAAATSSVA